MSNVILFANCGGAARSENCDPKGLGKDLRSKIEVKKKIFAIGMSEVIISTRLSTGLLCGPLGRGNDTSLLNDLEDFATGFQDEPQQKFYLPHLNSQDHCHSEAFEKKWCGQKASQRIAKQVNSLCTVYQGTAALLYTNFRSLEAIRIRPAGVDPCSAKGDNPLEYQGNRDSEPRSAIIFRELEIADTLVDLVFCQLETNSKDPRIGSTLKLESSKGVKHRMNQIDNLCSYLDLKKKNGERPMILMGDFNARPGTKELDYLCDEYGFLQVLPQGIPTLSAATPVWSDKYTFCKRRIDRPDYKLSEEDQGWPYSHLKHKILIDHAFVRGLPEEWSCELQVIELTHKDPKNRATDHRPISLTIKSR